MSRCRVGAGHCRNPAAGNAAGIGASEACPATCASEAKPPGNSAADSLATAVGGAVSVGAASCYWESTHSLLPKLWGAVAAELQQDKPSSLSPYRALFLPPPPQLSGMLLSEVAQSWAKMHAKQASQLGVARPLANRAQQRLQLRRVQHLLAVDPRRVRVEQIDHSHHLLRQERAAARRAARGRRAERRTLAAVRVGSREFRRDRGTQGGGAFRRGIDEKPLVFKGISSIPSMELIRCVLHCFCTCRRRSKSSRCRIAGTDSHANPHTHSHSHILWGRKHNLINHQIPESFC